MLVFEANITLLTTSHFVSLIFHQCILSLEQYQGNSTSQSQLKPYSASQNHTSLRFMRNCFFADKWRCLYARIYSPTPWALSYSTLRKVVPKLPKITDRGRVEVLFCMRNLEISLDWYFRWLGVVDDEFLYLCILPCKFRRWKVGSNCSPLIQHWLAH